MYSMKDDTYRNKTKCFAKTFSGSDCEHVPEKLSVDGNLVSNHETLLSIWANHAKKIASLFKLLPVVVKVCDTECPSYVESHEVLDF